MMTTPLPTLSPRATTYRTDAIELMSEHMEKARARMPAAVPHFEALLEQLRTETDKEWFYQNHQLGNPFSATQAPAYRSILKALGR
jgi:hypothetical protein